MTVKGMRSELDRISKITRRLNTVGEGLWSFRKVDCMCHIRVIEQKIECSAADGGTPADGGAYLNGLGLFFLDA